jgi:hypothetical protein
MLAWLFKTPTTSNIQNLLTWIWLIISLNFQSTNNVEFKKKWANPMFKKVLDIIHQCIFHLLSGCN